MLTLAVVVSHVAAVVPPVAVLPLAVVVPPVAVLPLAVVLLPVAVVVPRRRVPVDLFVLQSLAYSKKY